MSYHVQIVRTKDGAPDPISGAEVEALLAARPDLQLRREDDGTFTITAGNALLVLQDGEIWTKNPDDATLALLLELAGPLRARVRGDELETYRTVEETYVHPDDRALRASAQRASAGVVRRARLRQVLVMAIVMAVFVLLGLVARWVERR